MKSSLVNIFMGNFFFSVSRIISFCIIVVEVDLLGQTVGVFSFLYCPPLKINVSVWLLNHSFLFSLQLTTLGNLTPASTVFFCCDMQERFRPAIKYFGDIISVGQRLVCMFVFSSLLKLISICIYTFKYIAHRLSIVVCLFSVTGGPDFRNSRYCNRAVSQRSWKHCSRNRFNRCETGSSEDQVFNGVTRSRSRISWDSWSQECCVIWSRSEYLFLRFWHSIVCKSWSFQNTVLYIDCHVGSHNNSHPLFSGDCFHGTDVTTFCLLLHLTLTATLWAKSSCSPHSTDKKLKHRCCISAPRSCS